MTPAPVDRFRRVCARVDAGLPVDPADAAWLALGCREAIEAGRPLRTVFGLPARGGAGGLPRVARLAARDALLCAAYQHCFPNLEPRAAARAILAAVNLRLRARRPLVVHGDILDQLAAGAALPAERQLARIIRDIHTPV